MILLFDVCDYEWAKHEKKWQQQTTKAYQSNCNQPLPNISTLCLLMIKTSYMLVEIIVKVIESIVSSHVVGLFKMGQWIHKNKNMIF